MSREIKFRVWDKQDKKYWLTKNGLYFYLENLQDERLAVSISKFIEESDRFVVQQYTGLKDKSGKDIYEGDIGIVPVLDIDYETKDSNSPSGYASKINNIHVLIEFSSERGCYWGKDSTIKTYESGWAYHDGFVTRFTIVGNIYENAELIKK